MIWKSKLFITLFLSLVSFVLLFTEVPESLSERLVDAIWSFGHVITFALWTYLLVLLKPRFLPANFYSRLFCVVFIAVIAGGMVEIIQPYFHRRRELGDVWLNVLGALAAVIYIMPERKNIRRGMRWSLQMLLFVGLSVQLYPAAMTATDEVRSYWDFPLLSTFDSTHESGRWKYYNNGDPFRVVHGINGYAEGMLEITLSPAEYSGIKLAFLPKNWSQYDSLEIKFYNPDTNDIQIDGIVHDEAYLSRPKNLRKEYHKVFTLQPGWNTSIIPLHGLERDPKWGTLDLTSIASFGLFAYKLPYERLLYLDSVRLINLENAEALPNASNSPGE